MHTVLVTGATGRQGGAVARHLLARGHHVRAFVRHPGTRAARALATLGAELRVGDFDDPESIASASYGVDAMFAMATPFTDGGTITEERHAQNLVDGAARAGVPHVVYTSIASADRSTGVPHFDAKHRIERYLWSSGLAATVIAPTEFIDNFVAPWSLPLLRQGRIGTPVPPARVRQFTAVRDVAPVAALAIENPAVFKRLRIDVASDVSSGEAVAEVIARHAGQPVEYMHLPAPEDPADELGQLYRFIQWPGYRVDIEYLRRRLLPDVAWTSVDDWVRSHDWRRLLRRRAA